MAVICLENPQGSDKCECDFYLQNRNINPCEQKSHKVSQGWFCFAFQDDEQAEAMPSSSQVKRKKEDLPSRKEVSNMPTIAVNWNSGKHKHDKTE